ncbi:MAG: LysM peptidoglycan-binding domain-containing protein [Candidatus Aminicenantia bacterium]
MSKKWKNLLPRKRNFYLLNLAFGKKSKNKRFALLILIIIFTFLFWACSSHRPTQKEIKSEPSPTPSEIQKQQELEPEGETLIPPEEKEGSDEASLIQEKAGTEENEEASALIEEAMDAYQDAQLAWERGDFDTALTALDEAYSLILRAKLPQDSPLIQEKNDLRLLIARRIQEIYASRLVTVGDKNKTIPLVENKYVKEEIKLFQTKERKYFEESFKRSGHYRKMIIKELKKVGLPEELSWLPLIESGFKVRALSRARALGLWQFISSTGYRFDLKRDRWVDERMDPIKSTQAATKYLTELHSLFGDWTTALAAYNCGELRVQNVIRSQRINYLDNFWDLYIMLPRETARFVPRFIAALLIISNPEKYGFNLLSPDPPLKYEIISINRPVKLSSLSKTLGLKAEELTSFNPELRHDATPDYKYLLKVPVGMSKKAKIAVNALPRWIPPEATYIVHYVRRGETLSRIASRYRTSVSAIARLNRLRRVHLIRPGQRLKIPVRGRRYISTSALKSIKLGQEITYTVKRGDSLYHLAKIFNTTVRRIKQDNKLKSNVLHIGQKLVIQSGRPEGAIVYKVKAGDTPFDIAKKFGMNLNDLLGLNGLSTRSKIYPGQELWVIPKK